MGAKVKRPQHIGGTTGVTAVNCPSCGASDTGVVDSRSTDDGDAVRRRRECGSCETRFTTYERPRWGGPRVRKRGGETEAFDREKLLDGILRAVEKRPVDREEAERIADEVEETLIGDDAAVVSTEEIGDRVSERLKRLDEVAYLRFVSVYKEFSDASQFARELEEIEENERPR